FAGFDVHRRIVEDARHVLRNDGAATLERGGYRELVRRQEVGRVLPRQGGHDLLAALGAAIAIGAALALRLGLGLAGRALLALGRGVVAVLHGPAARDQVVRLARGDFHQFTLAGDLAADDGRLGDFQCLRLHAFSLTLVKTAAEAAVSWFMSPV